MTELILDKKFSTEKRKKMSEEGKAMPGGRFPIDSSRDVENAVRDYNRIGQPSDVKAHIIRRAKALGATSALPEGWTSDAAPETIVTLRDSFVLDGVRKTQDGYLTAFARVARTGVQVYKGKELGRPDLGDVRVYRSPEEVFHADAMHSMAHRPITLDHPGETVTAKNWKKYSVGQTGGEVVRDGDCVRVPMVVMDAAAIAAHDRGDFCENSMGYSTDLKWKSGTTEDGEAYDAVQTAIRANHLAMVPVARGGSKLRIGDDDTTSRRGEGRMEKTLVTLTLDGVPVETTEVGAAVIQRHFAALSDANKDLKGKLDKKAAEEEQEEEDKTRAEDAQKKALETKDGEIAALKKKLEDAEKAASPEALDKMVKDRATVIDRAVPLLDGKFSFDGKKIEDIRRAAVTAKLGDADAKAMSDAAIEGAFITLTKDTAAAGGTRALAGAISRNNRATVQDSADPREKALADREKTLTDAWKTPGAVARQ